MRRTLAVLAVLALPASTMAGTGAHVHKPYLSDPSHVTANASVPRGWDATLTLVGPNGEDVKDVQPKGGHLHVVSPCDETSPGGRWSAELIYRQPGQSQFLVVKSTNLPCA